MAEGLIRSAGELPAIRGRSRPALDRWVTPGVPCPPFARWERLNRTAPRHPEPRSPRPLQRWEAGRTGRTPARRDGRSLSRGDFSCAVMRKVKSFPGRHAQITHRRAALVSRVPCYDVPGGKCPACAKAGKLRSEERRVGKEC